MSTLKNTKRKYVINGPINRKMLGDEQNYSLTHCAIFPTITPTGPATSHTKLNAIPHKGNIKLYPADTVVE
jgi:hypothetical protein